MNSKNLELIEFSVTLRVKESVTHEFFNLHPHILAFAGVASSDWTWEKGAQKLLITPGFCSITYENGIRISGNNKTVNAAKIQDLELGGTHYPPGIAASYLTSLAPDVFEMADINWEIEVPFEEPIAWMTNRFFQANFISESWSDVETIPIIRFAEAGSVTTFSFVPRSERKEFLSIGCRISTASPVSDDHLARWLLNYQELEDRVLNNLLALLEIENDSN